MTPRGIVFDLDGTLVDSYEGIRDALSSVLVARGGGPVTLEDTRRFVGRGVETLIRRGLRAQGLPETAIPEAIHAFGERYGGIVYEKTVLLPGVAETIPVLKGRDIRMGVASNKPQRFSQMLIEHFGLLEAMPVVLGPEDVPAPKPDPAMILVLVRRLGLETGECVYVGDMPLDVETARNAGIEVWCVTFGGGSREELLAAKPDRLVDRFEEIATLCGA